jgi:nucleolar protein 58
LFVKNGLFFAGMRQNAESQDLTDILPEDVWKHVQEAAEISMGTEISDMDIKNITHLCDQVIFSFFFMSFIQI